jgi:nicotinamide mononucleotide adenylyltransferase
MVEHAADPNRSKIESNPFSFFLRYEMIDRSLRELGWPAGSFAIVPADISDVGRVNVFLPNPSDSTFLVTIYDAWGEEKVRRLTELQYSVEVLWRRSMTERLTSGTALRKLMRENGAWQSFVPPAVVECVERSGILPPWRK